MGNLNGFLCSFPFIYWLKNLDKAKISDDLKRKRAQRISELKKNLLIIKKYYVILHMRTPKPRAISQLRQNTTLMSRNLMKRYWFYLRDLLTRKEHKILPTAQLLKWFMPVNTTSWQMNSPCSYQTLTCPPGLISLPSQAFSGASIFSHSSPLSPPLHENTCKHSDLPPVIILGASTYNQSLPCATHFTHINSFNRHRNYRKQGLVLSPF